MEGDGAGRAFLGVLEASDDVLESGRHHKVLLLQTQHFPLKELQRKEAERPGATVRDTPARGRPLDAIVSDLSPYVIVGIEHSGNVLRQIPVEDSLDVIADVDCEFRKKDHNFNIPNKKRNPHTDES